MADRKTVRLENRQLAALSDMEEDEAADTESEALRTALNVGLAELGYYNGTGRSDGTLIQITHRLADAFALLGLMLLGVTWWYPLGLRMFVVAPFGASIACYLVARGLERYDVAVSDRLRGLFAGGERV